MQRVVIVRQGIWGEPTSRDDYDAWVKFIERAIKEVLAKATVRRVETFKEAEMAVQGGMVDVLVFVSPEMIPVAGKIKETYPDLRVVLFSGLPTKEEDLTKPLIFVKKADVRDG